MTAGPEAAARYLAEVARAPATDIEDETVLDVHPDNVVPVQLVLAMETQWRWGQAGGGMGPVLRFREGLDYAALKVVSGALEVDLTAPVLTGVRELERAAIRYDHDALARAARGHPSSRPSRRAKRGRA